jgi:RimJ/RimL family protein N-acetyltransferase
MDILLETERLLIRPLNVGDSAFIHKLLNTPSWLQFIGDRNIRTLVDAENYLVNGPFKSYQEHGFGPWLVCLKQDNDPIGICGLFKREFLHSPDLGFAFLPEFEGRGYAAEAVAATLAYSEQRLSLRNIVAFTESSNTRSVRLLERTGFRFKEMIKPPKEDHELMLFAIDLATDRNGTSG